MRRILRAARAVVVRAPWAVAALGGGAAALLLGAALVVGTVAGPVAVGLAVAGVLVAAMTLVAQVRVSSAERAAVRRELTLLRQGVASLARDTESSARSLRRLDDTTTRAIAGALGLRSSAGRAVDAALLAATAVLGTSRELLVVGDDPEVGLLRENLLELSPTAVVSHLVTGREVHSLQRRQDRRRTKTPALPCFVAVDEAAVTRLVAGELPELIGTILRVPDYLVALPPGLRPQALRIGTPGSVVTVADAIVLIRLPN